MNAVVFFMFDLSQCTEQEMDGEGTVGAFATCPGPDCLKDVVLKYGSRVKVYNAIRAAINENYQQKVPKVACVFITHCTQLCIAVHRVKLPLVPLPQCSKGVHLCLSRFEFYL